MTAVCLVPKNVQELKSRSAYHFMAFCLTFGIGIASSCEVDKPRGSFFFFLSVAREVGNLCCAYREKTVSRAEEYKASCVRKFGRLYP